VNALSGAFCDYCELEDGTGGEGAAEAGVAWLRGEKIT